MALMALRKLRKLKHPEQKLLSGAVQNIHGQHMQATNEKLYI